MSTALRCWIAGGALLASALVLSTRGALGDLAGWGPAALLVVLVNAWVIAVAERASPPRGLRAPRFPLARRLMGVEPGLLGIGLTVLALAFLCTRSWQVTAWTALVFAILGVASLRRAAWYLVPAAAVVHGLLTMPEFHTLGDLVGEMGHGLARLAWVVGLGLVACGPLLRTDAGALGWCGRWVAVLAALPGYLGAAYLAGRVPQLAAQPAPLLFLAVLLAGGIVQSMLLGAMAWAVRVRDRPAASASPASPYRVGMALLPLFLPGVLLAALPLVPWPAGSLAAAGAPQGVAAETWVAAMLVLLLVPAVPAAALVGAALDRIDGRRGAALASSVAGFALLGWLAFGPQLLPRLLAPDGPVELLVALCGLDGREPAFTAVLTPATDTARPGLVLLGLSASDGCRAATALVLACALLAARRLVHARPGGLRFGWTGPALLLVLACGAAWGLAPRLGPVGMLLGMAGACALMLAVDLVRGAAPVRLAPPADEPGTLVPDQHDRRREGGAVAGGRRATDLPAPADPEPGLADVPAASAVREAIT